MSTRKELIAATKLRYGAGNPSEKRTILEEFVGLTGYHRKHAISNCSLLSETLKASARQRSLTGLERPSRRLDLSPST